MTKEDISLPVEMERLEIEPGKVIKSMPDDKQQIRGSFFSRAFVQNLQKCSCPMQRKNRNIITKKKNNRILKEPVLKLLQSNDNNNVIKLCNSSNKSLQFELKSSKLKSNVNVHALVDNCNQLKISMGSDEKKALTVENNEWWKNEASNVKTETVPEKGPIGSCSHQALNPPCDVTIDELASYFETLVHIPRKMSSMAEMMYI